MTNIQIRTEVAEKMEKEIQMEIDRSNTRIEERLQLTNARLAGRIETDELNIQKGLRTALEIVQKQYATEYLWAIGKPGIQDK